MRFAYEPGTATQYLENGMTDILADYREWREGLPLRIGTHSDRCHMWHERCLIHRLAREVERLRAALEGAKGVTKRRSVRKRA